jgi:hypothetical protein
MEHVMCYILRQTKPLWVNKTLKKQVVPRWYQQIAYITNIFSASFLIKQLGTRKIIFYIRTLLKTKSSTHNYSRRQPINFESKMARRDSFGGYEEERFENKVDIKLQCSICLKVLKDPVQCPNEHYFCRSCIQKCLHENSETCPMCQYQLTEETLEEASLM